MIIVKLLTEEEAVDEVVFPEEVEHNSSDVINQAQIFIPGSVILRQFKIEGITAVLNL